MKPIIGISTSYDFDDRTYKLRENYVKSILKAGGLPVMLAADTEYDIVQACAEICDAIVISGGGDAHPSYWGELPDRELGEINPLRDVFEMQLASLMIENCKPILGICRGCQIINIVDGGSLYQHLAGKLMHQQKAPRNYAFHQAFIQTDSKLAAILKTDQIIVNSFHHQAVKMPGQNMRISACAADGTIEAIEFADHSRFIVGIQWHPECMEDTYADCLFRALVDAARTGNHS